MAGRYAYFTRKQAGILYGATKRGTLAMKRADIRRMYNLVEREFGSLGYEDLGFIAHLENAIDHLFADRTEFAQAELDGKHTYSKPHIIGHVHLVVTEANVDVVRDEIDLFAEVGDVIDEDVDDGTDWFIRG